jgi:exopolysaccharide biosynthesis polyprenyl glycosylphosphotransferase
VGHFRRQFLLNTMKLFDQSAMVMAFAVSAAVVSTQASRISFTEFFSLRIKIQNFIIFLILMLIWHQIFKMFRMYASRRFDRRWDETRDIVKATTLGTALILAAGLTAHIALVTREFLFVFWVAVTILTVASRLVLRTMLRQIRLHGRNLRDILMVGSNARAVQFACKIRANQTLGYRIKGFVDQEWPGMSDIEESGFHRVCDFDGLLSYLRTNVVDEVVVALPMRTMHSQASQVAAICEEQGIVIRFVSTLFDGKISRPRVEELEGDSLITHYTGTLEGWPVVVKRIVDIVFSAILLVLLSPVLLLTALLIKLTSPGPVMFVQKRLGLGKRHFGIYKFRTMVVDAEKRMKEIEHLNEVSGPVFKIKNDPRITPLGKFLRKTSIDELPQLLNVFKGDMSLVGPRPLPIRDYEGFSEDWQRRRFSVRPGITCLWQIGGRSGISFEKWMELDLQYIDKWSLMLDFQILLKTIPAVLRGSGAA